MGATTTDPKQPATARPQWLDAWADYPHGALTQEKARELVWYAIGIENAHDTAVKLAEAVLKVIEDMEQCNGGDLTEAVELARTFLREAGGAK